LVGYSARNMRFLKGKDKKADVTVRTGRFCLLLLQLISTRALLSQFGGDPRFVIKKLDAHRGFALAVKVGLELCGTPYAVVCQHDRVFTTKFRRLPELVAAMEVSDAISLSLFSFFYPCMYACIHVSTDVYSIAAELVAARRI
jgi:hypothetical protein